MSVLNKNNLQLNEGELKISKQYYTRTEVAHEKTSCPDYILNSKMQDSERIKHEAPGFTSKSSIFESSRNLEQNYSTLSVKLLLLSYFLLFLTSGANLLQNHEKQSTQFQKTKLKYSQKTIKSKRNFQT